jgi:hypothetical protein
MHLNLNIDKLAGPGRLPAKLEVEYVRDLNAADFALMSSEPLGSKPPAIKRLTDRHHALARLLAAGTPEGEAALILNYDISRVSILKNSPAFQQLVALYRGEVQREFASVIDHMAGISRDALVILRDRMEDNEDRFSNNELMKIATDFTDRTVDRNLDTARLPTVIELVAPVFATSLAEPAAMSEEADV